MIRPVVFVILGTCMLAGSLVAAGPISVNDEGTLVRDGRPYRAIGVNYFDCFGRTLRDPADRSYENGFAELEKLGIPFARIMACGFWPSDMRLYQQDKAAYFRLLDGVVQSAEKHNVGLIMSLFWNSATVPDLVGESRNQWGNANSKTIGFMRTYIGDLVQRYVNSPAIWGWEFGNEFALDADLPNAASHRPPVVPSVGTPTTRTAADDVTHEIVRAAFMEFAREVRRHEPKRLIISGNSVPRATAWHQWREHNWKKDSPEQYTQMLLGDNPDPMNVISIHAYDDFDVAPSLQIARAAKKPLFVGEFGASGADDDAREKFLLMLKSIEENPVPLAALWVYDYRAQDNKWNVTASNPRSYQLRAIAEANRRISSASER